MYLLVGDATSEGSMSSRGPVHGLHNIAMLAGDLDLQSVLGPNRFKHFPDMAPGLGAQLILPRTNRQFLFDADIGLRAEGLIHGRLGGHFHQGDMGFVYGGDLRDVLQRLGETPQLRPPAVQVGVPIEDVEDFIHHGLLAGGRRISLREVLQEIGTQPHPHFLALGEPNHLGRYLHSLEVLENLLESEQTLEDQEGDGVYGQLGDLLQPDGNPFQKHPYCEIHQSIMLVEVGEDLAVQDIDQVLLTF